MGEVRVSLPVAPHRTVTFCAVQHSTSFLLSKGLFADPPPQLLRVDFMLPHPFTTHKFYNLIVFESCHVYIYIKSFECFQLKSLKFAAISLSNTSFTKHFEKISNIYVISNRTQKPQINFFMRH